MPPRPPVTTLVIHTWKEHGKPRPLSNQEKSTQAARDRISRSLSYEAYLAHLKQPDEDLRSSEPHCRPAVLRSTSVEEGLLAAKCSPVVAVSPLSLLELSDDDSDSSCGTLPVPRCISTPLGVDKAHTLSPSNETTKRNSHAHNRGPERMPEGLPPRPGEWPLCQRRRISRGRGAPPRAVSLLLAEDLPHQGKARRVGATSFGTTALKATMLGESLIKGSSCFGAGLWDVARRGIVQTGIAPNV